MVLVHGCGIEGAVAVIKVDERLALLRDRVNLRVERL